MNKDSHDLFWAITIGQFKIQTADCRLGTINADYRYKCRLQTSEWYIVSSYNFPKNMQLLFRDHLSESLHSCGIFLACFFVYFFGKIQ